jgi:hypothetical protein
VSSLHALRAFALLAGAAVLLSSGVVRAAGDADGDGIPDDVEAATARNVFAHDAPGGFLIRSRSIGAVQDDAIEFGYTDGKFTVAYFASATGPQTVSYQLEFRRILEVYRENGEWKESRRYDISMDSAKMRHSEVRTRDGETEVLYTVSTASGNLTVTVGSVNRFARIAGNRLLSPMEVKVDIAISGWVYARNDSRLALQVEVNGTSLPRVNETSDDEAAGWATDEAAVTVDSGPDSVFFAWDKAAIVDNVTRPVEVTRLEPNSNGYEMRFIYERGATIVHDPKVGAVSNAFWSIWSLSKQPVPAFDATFYIIGIGVAAGLVGLTVLLRRRRRDT